MMWWQEWLMAKPKAVWASILAFPTGLGSSSFRPIIDGDTETR